MGIKIKNHPDEDEFLLDSITEDCSTTRLFDRKNKAVHMIEFILNPSLDKGLGKGTEIFSNQVKEFQKQGFKELKTTAAKSDIYNGYYTWARLGYEMSDQEDKERLKIDLSSSKNKKINSANSLQELMTTSEGRDYWKKNGFKFEGTFDLSEGSKSQFILNKYMEEKKNAKK